MKAHNGILNSLIQEINELSSLKSTTRSDKIIGSIRSLQEAAKAIDSNKALLHGTMFLMESAKCLDNLPSE